MLVSNSIARRLADALASGGWRSTARPNQLPPPGDWNTWLLLAGRGFGKTRSGSEFVRENVEMGTAKRIALVAPTAADARDVIVEGESGILAVSSSWCRPDYEPSKRRLTWPNGAVGTLFSADEPDRLRGPQFDLAWCDELAAWTYASDCWNMLMLGLRLGKHPRCLVTTTPRPIRILKELIAREGADVVVTRGSTFENAENLAAPFLLAVRARYEGTRLGRQELNAEILDDLPGALWSRAVIEAARHSGELPLFRRVVVAVDPAVTSGEDSDETGIVVAARGADGRGYLLDDATGRYSPAEWAARAITLYDQHKADCIVAEGNQGGQMVRHTIESVRANLPIKIVHASRGKVARAEPVSALYEQNKIRHVGNFSQLEDQLCGFTSDFDRARAGYSPDRLDALVWAFTELMVGSIPSAFATPILFSRESQGDGLNPAAQWSASAGYSPGGAGRFDNVG